MCGCVCVSLRECVYFSFASVRFSHVMLCRVIVTRPQQTAATKSLRVGAKFQEMRHLLATNCSDWSNCEQNPVWVLAQVPHSHWKHPTAGAIAFPTDCHRLQLLDQHALREYPL
jgi:hypothetical protein